MRRKAQDDLHLWFKQTDRKPLLLRGARQVGKTTLVQLFCQENSLQLIEINLEKTKLTSIHSDNFHIQDLLDEIQLKMKQTITDQTIIFFDEIQESPKLLKYLRYFYEEAPSLAVIGAGSLLEITMRDESFSFPVGRVEFYHLGPMTYFEFLLATKQNFLYEQLVQMKLSKAVLQEAKKMLALYYYIGGMPKAILEYTKHNSLIHIRNIHSQIIQAYVSDFPKYAPRINTSRIEKVMYSVITQLGKKIVYKKLDQESASKEIRRALELLVDARVLLKCNHTDGNSIPLMGEADLSIFKVYFLDIGLVNSILNLDIDVITSEINLNFNSKGMLAEQFVAQHLAYLKKETTGPELFYWLRDKGSQNAEVDFLLQKKSSIVPIEVKASSTGHLKSLFYFCNEKKIQTGVKASLSDYSINRVSHKIGLKDQNMNLVSLPHYLIERIYELI